MRKIIEGRPQLVAKDIAFHQNFMLGALYFDIARMWHTGGEGAGDGGLANTVMTGAEYQ